MRQRWRFFVLLLALPFLLVVQGSRLAAPANGWNSEFGIAGASSVSGPITAPPGLSPEAAGFVTAGTLRVGANPGRVGGGGPAAEPAHAATTPPIGRAFVLATSSDHRLPTGRIHDQFRGRAPPSTTEATAFL